MDCDLHIAPVMLGGVMRGVVECGGAQAPVTGRVSALETRDPGLFREGDGPATCLSSISKKKMEGKYYVLVRCMFHMGL